MSEATPIGRWHVGWGPRLTWTMLAVGGVCLGVISWRVEGDSWVVGAGLSLMFLRPCVGRWWARVTLYQDRVECRGYVRTVVIPLVELAAVDGGGRASASVLFWGEERCTFTAVDLLADAARGHVSDSRAQVIMRARDDVLAAQGLTAREDPRDIAARERAELIERGWVEKYNP